MKSEIMPYKRIAGEETRTEKKGNGSVWGIEICKRDIFMVSMAFLLGRASIAGGMMPFGIAAYAAVAGRNENRVMLALGIIAGMVTAGAWEQIYITVSAMLLFNAFNMMVKGKKQLPVVSTAGIAFISGLVPQTVALFLQGMLLYDVFRALFSSFIVFTLVFVFRSAVSVMDEGYKVHVMNTEQTISAGIVMALALSGLSGVQLFGFTLRNILCILTVLILSFKSGAGAGAATGVTIGLIISMSSSTTPLVIASYAFCGLLAGVFRNLGKMGSSLGFVLGNAILTVYLTGSTEILVHLKEIVLAVLLFLTMPKRFTDFLSGMLGGLPGSFPDKRSYSLRIKEITVNRLNKFSGAFKQLARTFGEISQTSVKTEKQDIASLLDKIAGRICKDCSLCLHCWDRNFYDTYQMTYRIIERIDSKGRLEASDIPDSFIEKCPRVNDFVSGVNSLYELFKVDLMWKKRIGESRGLVSQQMDGLSKVISNLAAEIDVDLHFKEELENAVLVELSRMGIRAEEALVFQNKWGKYEINIFHNGCGGKRSCVSCIEKAVSAAVGRKMTKEGTDCLMEHRRNTCNLKLIEEEGFKVSMGVAKASKHDCQVSGDSYTFMNAGDGKYIIALSDGMGAGQKAANQSRATISMLEQFMDSGFDKDTAIKLINSVLVLKSDEDSFSTIDMTVIDLYDGEVEFVKVGAVPTFIKREQKVETVRTVSLPAGILENVELELVHKKVKSGDFIIMMSDGVMDSFSESSVVDFIESTTSMNAQEIADLILFKAYENNEGKPHDDMLVMAAKVWERV